ncbi:DUF6318 family protein [Pseudarthrobacter defluvii]|uniref:DUF6318 family protein n=1 Tax=Pseudarthrobacter defluvii TaxID=410837 RepID=UPI002576B14A|nr:DUF6318 family protein [Pseudarthrobacter defluvii]WJH25293.1 hypothetical protein JCQ34_04175 [Pseudarthrobacter defluvii]
MTSQNFHSTRAFVSSRTVQSGVAALVVGLALALSGCNPGDSPGPGGTSSPVAAETPTASATVTPTPTPSAVYKPADASGPAQNVPVPVLPEVAKTETKEGLEAFTRYWYAALSYAYETGDINALDSVSGSTCASCKKVKQEVIDWHSSGRWLEGGRVSVDAVDSNFVQSQPSTYQAIAQVQQEAIAYHLSDGSVKGRVAALPTTPDIVVATYNGNSWKAQTVEHMVK